MLDFALKERPEVLNVVYGQLADSMVNRHPSFSFKNWIGRILKWASSTMTPENARDQLLKVAGGGTYAHIKRADLAARVFAEL